MAVGSICFHLVICTKVWPFHVVQLDLVVHHLSAADFRSPLPQGRNFLPLHFSSYRLFLPFGELSGMLIQVLVGSIVGQS